MQDSDRRLISIVFTFVIAISLPFLLIGFEKAKNYLSRASARPANIVVDVEDVRGLLPQVWRAIAQGGEDSDRTLFQVRDEIQELEPRYIRLDHIYDQYNIVRQESNGELTYDFSELDQTVFDILAGESKPFFSLSYMPEELSSDGTIVGKPRDWNEWQNLVRATVQHYSGNNELGIKDVYYEVWNEPDLFGEWKTYGEKNYLDLYYFAARGAESAQNTKAFYFGGPATTAPYKNWMTRLVTYAREGNLKLDFISWHRYSTDPEQYRKDVLLVNEWLKNYSYAENLPFLITEAGFDSENNPAHDNKIAAAHTVAVVDQVIPGVDSIYNFELKDGLSPQNYQYWGRWGILTHDRFNNNKKPRFFALKLLNKLGGNISRRLRVSGEGDFVKAIAVRELGEFRILLYNYDPQNKYTEKTSVTLNNLPENRYNVTQEDLDGNKRTWFSIANGKSLREEVILSANSVVLLKFTPHQIY